MTIGTQSTGKHERRSLQVSHAFNAYQPTTTIQVSLYTVSQSVQNRLRCRMGAPSTTLVQQQRLATASAYPLSRISSIELICPKVAALQCHYSAIQMPPEIAHLLDYSGKKCPLRRHKQLTTGQGMPPAIGTHEMNVRKLLKASPLLCKISGFHNWQRTKLVNASNDGELSSPSRWRLSSG